MGEPAAVAVSAAAGAAARVTQVGGFAEGHFVDGRCAEGGFAEGGRCPGALTRKAAFGRGECPCPGQPAIRAFGEAFAPLGAPSAEGRQRQRGPRAEGALSGEARLVRS